MKNGLADKVINNFYLRNIVVLLVLLSASIAKKTYAAGGFLFSGFVYSCIIFTIYYALITFHNVILFQKLFRQRKYVLYFVALVLLFFAYHQFVLPPFKRMFRIEDALPESFTDKLLVIYGYLVDTCIGLGLYLGFHYFRQREDSLKLMYLKRELELKQLKGQLHPHFLFNALNNIYSYSLEKNPHSEVLILKLGALMRFILENAEKDTIPVTEEITFTEHYIAFERERLGNRCTVSFTQNINAGNIPIAPFILFTFVENAFKHGTARVEPSHIGIDLTVNNNYIRLAILNPVNSTTFPTTRTGLANIRRRLELIYPHTHALVLNAENGTFKTELTLNLDL